MNRCFALLTASWTILLAASLIAKPSPQTDDLKTQVAAALAKLADGPKVSDRVAAEWKLLQLGPDILPLLPPADKTPPKVEERLKLVRSTLMELLPRTWTPKNADMALADALAGLKKATGLTLADRRKVGDAKSVKLDKGETTYWEIVERFALQTDSRLSLYQTDGQVALIDGPNPQLPVRLQGAFRIGVKRVRTELDFESKTHTGVLGLEIAWEPRFSPYLIEVGKLTFHDNRTKGDPIVTTVPASGPITVTERNAREFDIIFPAPQRATKQIDKFTGLFVVTMPSKSLTYAFNGPMKDAKQSKDGVDVAVTKIDMGQDRWIVDLTIDVPAAGPKFDSFQTWLGSKAWHDQAACHFERVVDGNKEVLQANPLWSGPLSNPFATRLVVRYGFKPGQNADDPDWRLVCRVPGRMVEVRVPFAFEKIELP